MRYLPNGFGPGAVLAVLVAIVLGLAHNDAGIRLAQSRQQRANGLYIQAPPVLRSVGKGVGRKKPHNFAIARSKSDCLPNDILYAAMAQLRAEYMRGLTITASKRTAARNLYRSEHAPLWRY